MFFPGSRTGHSSRFPFLMKREAILASLGEAVGKGGVLAPGPEGMSHLSRTLTDLGLLKDSEL